MIWQKVKAFWQITQKPVSAVPCCSWEACVWVETFGQGCCRRLMAPEHSQPRISQPTCLGALIISRGAGCCVRIKMSSLRSQESPSPSPQPGTDPVKNIYWHFYLIFFHQAQFQSTQIWVHFIFLSVFFGLLSWLQYSERFLLSNCFRSYFVIGVFFLAISTLRSLNPLNVSLNP